MPPAGAASRWMVVILLRMLPYAVVKALCTTRRHPMWLGMTDTSQDHRCKPIKEPGNDMQTEMGWNPALVDAIQQPIWTVRPDGTVDYANPFWRSYTGLSWEASLDYGWTAAVHPDDVTSIEARWRTAVETGEAYEIEYRFRRADGIYRWHLARVAPIPGPDGTDVRWAGTAIDIDDRRQADEALRAGEARYRDVVDYADDIVYTLLLDGELAAVNPAVQRVLGYRPDELIGRSIEPLIVPSQLARSREMLQRKMSGTGRTTYELDLIAKDGHRVTLEINNRLVVSAGRPLLIHGIARDISGRRERRQQADLMAAVGTALTTQQALPDQLQPCVEAMVTHLDAAFVRIWTLDDTDPTILVLRASAGLYTHLDGPHGRIPIGQWKIGRIAAQRQPHLTNSVVDDPEIHDQEWARREGMVSFAGYPLLVGERLLGVVALFARRPLRETTLVLLSSVMNAIAVGIDRHRAETARESLLLLEREARTSAEEAQTRYRSLFEGVADAILVVDPERHYRDANAAATALLGYSREELIQLQVDDVVAVESIWTQAEFERFAAEGQWQGELELRRKDGSTVPVEARATVVNLPDGPVYLSAVRDISERNQLERLQRDFLAMVTHDLRSPLTAVKGWTQLLRRRTDVDDRAQRTVARILTQVDQMERLIGDLAELVRIEAGQLQVRRERTDLVELAHEQVALVQAQTGAHTLRVESHDVSIAATVDRHRVGQVLQNLLINAVKYSPDGGSVTVRLGVVDREARIDVIDHGVGIPPDHLDRLFERFYRADVTGAGGLGLGLHITKMLVEAHDGRISVTSTPGQGTTFTVALPLTPQPPRDRHTRPSAREPAPPRSRRSATPQPPSGS